MQTAMLACMPEESADASVDAEIECAAPILNEPDEFP